MLGRLLGLMHWTNSLCSRTVDQHFHLTLACPDVCRYGHGVFSIFPACLDARSSQEATFSDINQAVSAPQFQVD